MKASTFLEAEQNEIGAIIASRTLTESPYWHAEKSRIGQSRRVPVELIVNGKAVATQEIVADGHWEDLTFDYTLDQSSWIAIRILPSAHTNPIFVLADGEPIQDKQSAEWCLRAVDQCWQMKSSRFKEDEMAAAEKAYDYARKVYRELIEKAGN